MIFLNFYDQFYEYSRNGRFAKYQEFSVSHSLEFL